MDNPTGSETDLEQDPLVKTMLRRVAIVFPPVVPILAFLFCWRAHFSRNSLQASGITLAFGIYLAVYCHRRSRGLSASFGNVNPGPDRDWGYNDQSDIAALWVAAILIGGMVYMVIKHW